MHGACAGARAGLCDGNPRPAWRPRHPMMMDRIPIGGQPPTRTHEAKVVNEGQPPTLRALLDQFIGFGVCRGVQGGIDRQGRVPPAHAWRK